MKLYAPGYYKSFKCIADRCEHSCCIGWEIDVDEDTLKKYNQCKDGYGAVVASSISMTETPHFKLDKHDRCPHLNDQGLCNIITHLGEEYLCDICREHPRFYNFTSVAEVGIGLSCPEAARIVLRSDDYTVMEEIGEILAAADDLPFDARCHRSRIYEIIQDSAESYTDALKEIRCTYSATSADDESWLEALDSLEYLDDGHKALFAKYSSELRPVESKMTAYLKRFLAYLLYRHCTEALDESDFSVRLSFCLFCEQLLASLICRTSAKNLQDVASLACIISEEIEYSEDNTLTLMRRA